MDDDSSPAVTAGINLASSLAKLGFSAFAQHTARLKGATNENQALDQIIPAFDADLKEIVEAFNGGEATEAECVEALQEVDNNVLKYALSLVGPPGTAWNAPKNLGSQVNASYSATCDKGCTVSCCVYLNDLRPAIYGRFVGSGAFQEFTNQPQIVGGLIEAIQNGSGTVKVITVAKPVNTAYGNYQRAGYSFTIKKPPLMASSGALLAKTLTLMTGGFAGGAVAVHSTGEVDTAMGNQLVAPAPDIASSNPLDPFTGGSNMMTIIIVFAVLLLGFAVVRK